MATPPSDYLHAQLPVRETNTFLPVASWVRGRTHGVGMPHLFIDGPRVRRHAHTGFDPLVGGFTRPGPEDLSARKRAS
jgi:hypothetical protein